MAGQYYDEKIEIEINGTYYDVAYLWDTPPAKPDPSTSVETVCSQCKKKFPILYEIVFIQEQEGDQADILATSNLGKQILKKFREYLSNLFSKNDLCDECGPKQIEKNMTGNL